jgi:hypothetical protein
MVRSAFRIGIVACVVLIASQAWAIPIVPGQTAIAVAEPDPVGGLVVAGPLVSPMIGVAFTGTLTSTVIQGDATNPFGGLTFIYQVANSPLSVDAIGRFTVTGYNGWMTDMSFQPAGGVPPATMDRSLAGTVVAYSFVGPPLGPAVLAPGMVSETLVVQTNAPRWIESIGNVIDGSIASGSQLLQLILMVSVSQYQVLYYTVTTLLQVQSSLAQTLSVCTSTQFGKQLQLMNGYTTVVLTN